MANKNLKSIKFPGLGDTYIVPQVDTTLTQTGRPADAKATGDAISALGDSVDEDIDALKEDLTNKLDSQIEICPPETESFNNNPTTAWFTYQDITLKKGVTYSVNANTKNDTHTAKFALVDILTSTVVSIIDSGNTVTITPTCDCWLLVNSCKYGTGSDLRAVKASTQTLSVGTVVDFTVNINTVTFDLFVYAVVADEDVVDGLALINKFNNRKVVTVDINGNGDYTSVINAMNTEPEGTVIYILPGVYEQDMTACLKKRVILIGADRNQCIIRDTDGRYGHHALYVSCGYFENLTIEEPYVSGTSQTIGMGLGAYAVHIDVDEDYAIGKQAEFYHCTIKSDFFPAMGVGLRKNMTLILDNCILENGQINGRGDYSDEGTLGALYFHDSNGSQGNQYVILKDNVFKSKLQYALCPYQVDRATQNNHVHCDFINNVLYSEVGKYTDTVWFRGDPFNSSTGIFDIGIGYGNSIASLNN